MKVLQFGFGNRGAHNHLPHRMTVDTVAYTGTHDNDTTQGWWHSATKTERAAVDAYAGPVRRSSGVAADPRPHLQAWRRWRLFPRRICSNWALRRA